MTDAQLRKYFALKKQVANILAEHVSEGDLRFIQQMGSIDFWEHCIQGATSEWPTEAEVGFPSTMVVPRYGPNLKKADRTARKKK